MIDIYTQMIDVAPLLMITGVFAGLLAGLFGVGGGIVMVPVLFFVFGHLGMDTTNAMKLATGTSLAAMIPSAISSVTAHRKAGNVDFSLIKQWFPWMLLGILFGSYVLTQYSSPLFILLFAILAGFVSYRMFFNPHSNTVSDFSNGVQRSIASAIGFVSVMIGVGGGTIGVPVLHKMGLAIHRAVGTSAVFGVIVSIPGAIIMLTTATTPPDSPIGTFGAVHGLSLLFIVPLTIFFAPIGVKLGKKLDPIKLKKLFAIVLFITSIRMLTQSLGV